MGQIKCEPKSEMAVREWIAAHLDELGFDIVRSVGAFPDLTLRNADGQDIRTEVEYKSANFIQHKHDPAGCDLVICWKHNSVLPVRVLELSTGAEYEPNQEPAAQEPLVRFDNGQSSTDEMRAALADIPHLTNDFLQLMAKDLRVRSDYSRQLAETRLPILSITKKIAAHLGSCGISFDTLHPDDLLTLIV